VAGKSHIGAAVDELHAEREHLVARLGKSDAAIAAVREAFHLPPAAPHLTPKPRAAAKAAQRRNGRVDPSDDAILAALSAGPVSPGELAAQLGVERARLRGCLVRLEEHGLIASMGATATRRVFLPEHTPAKEAP
jgi:predicted Rossmann fold nucleotide-binding protein DprA/Smf involved in DNA uptake